MAIVQALKSFWVIPDGGPARLVMPGELFDSADPIVVARPTKFSAAVGAGDGGGGPHSHTDAEIPAAIARDTEVTSAVTAHEQAANPHPAYATDADLASHEAAADPHSGYLKESDHTEAAHTAYTGLATQSELDAVAAAKANTSHTHVDGDLPAGLARDAEVAAAYQPLDSDLTAIAALATTAFGRGQLALADAVALAANHNHGGGSAPVYADLGAATALALATNDVVKVSPSATGTLTTTVPAAGHQRIVVLLQTNTTAKTMTFGTGFKPSGTLALGTTANRLFVVSWVSDGTNLIEASRTAAITA